MSNTLTHDPVVHWARRQGVWALFLYISLWDVSELANSKANTLLADHHLFSPALLLAEQIERGLIEMTGRSNEPISIDPYMTRF